MKIVYMGTPDFAVEPLKAIYESGHRISLVVSRADKPKGRGYVLTPSPVKAFALQKDIPVLTPNKLSDEGVYEALKAENADLFIVAAYGRILPQSVLDLPRLGCFNIHASLLPEFRGAAPINRAVMAGKTIGGVTVMRMDAGMDTGDIIFQRETEIPDDMTAGEYHDKLAVLGANAIRDFLDMANNGDITCTKQDESNATFAPKITNDDMLITFNESPKATVDRIRGLSPYPAAYCSFEGRRFKLLCAVASNGKGKNGELISVDKGGLEFACEGGSVIITYLTPEGKSALSAESFLRGHKLKLGEMANG